MKIANYNIHRLVGLRPLSKSANICWSYTYKTSWLSDHLWYKRKHSESYKRWSALTLNKTRGLMEYRLHVGRT